MKREPWFISIVPTSYSDTFVLRIVRIFSIDLATGREELKIERSIPSVFIFRIMLRGDLMMIHVPHALQVILIDWRLQRCVIVDYADSMVSVVCMLIDWRPFSLMLVASLAEPMPVLASLSRSILSSFSTLALSP